MTYNIRENLFTIRSKINVISFFSIFKVSSFKPTKDARTLYTPRITLLYPRHLAQENIDEIKESKKCDLS